jgi:hypothetical protein
MSEDSSDAEQVLAERDFFWRRLLSIADPGDRSMVGRSSEAMLEQAVHGLPEPRAWPSDRDDLRRCEMTLADAPPHLQERMRPTLERFRTHVSVGGLHCAGCDTSGHTSLSHGKCWACQPRRALAAEGVGS